MQADQEGAADQLAWRLGASLFLGALWLSLIIIWLFFMAGEFSVYQNLAVVLLSLTVVAALLLILWGRYGINLARQMEKIEIDWKGKSGFSRRRLSITLLVWGTWMASVIAWLLLFAEGYNAYQSLAVILVSLIIAGGAVAMLWTVVKG